MKRWGAAHRLSSAYSPNSNCRAEVRVKAGKRLLRDKVGPGGNLDSEKMMRAMLEYRNMPDRNLKLSPL